MFSLFTLPLVTQLACKQYRVMSLLVLFARQVNLKLLGLAVAPGDLIGLHKLTEVLPVVHFVKPTVSTRMWYHGHISNITTGTTLRFQQVDLPFHFSIVASFSVVLSAKRTSEDGVEHTTNVTSHQSGHIEVTYFHWSDKLNDSNAQPKDSSKTRVAVVPDGATSASPRTVDTDTYRSPPGDESTTNKAITPTNMSNRINFYKALSDSVPMSTISSESRTGNLVNQPKKEQMFKV